MKVLIVDDTKTLLSVIQIYLMGWGLEFVEAYDGLEALKKAQETRPALVISDVRMPGMDGFELCAALRADPKLHDPIRYPAAVCTRSGRKEDARHHDVEGEGDQDLPGRRAPHCHREEDAGRAPRRCRAGVLTGLHRGGRGHRHADLATAGAVVPAARRPQPTALASGVRGTGRVPAADPARPVHLRHGLQGDRGRRTRRRRAGRPRWPACPARRSRSASTTRTTRGR